MILVTGGARSGKSTLAETIAQDITKEQGKVLYIATAWTDNVEMQQRIKLHQLSRPAHWQTHEGHRHLAQVITEQSPAFSVILLECVTTLLTNLLFDIAGDSDPEDMDFVVAEHTLQQQFDELIGACAASNSTIIVVTNEVGLGIVPHNRLARHFCDIAGRINQKLARHAHTVYLVVSGIDMKIKG